MKSKAVTTMDRERQTAEQPAQTENTCRHHWIIDTPSGPVSHGVCKHCGSAKEFQNYQFDFSWEDSVMPQPITAAAVAGDAEEEEAA